MTQKIFRIVPRYKYDAHCTLNEMLERLSRNRSSIGANTNADDYEEQGMVKKLNLYRSLVIYTIHLEVYHLDIFF